MAVTGIGHHGMSRRAALGCLAGLAATACRRGSLRTVRVATLRRFLLAPLSVADELGYFRDAGLSIDLQLTDTAQVLPLLAAGQVDVTFAGATPVVFNAVAQGARTRIVAAREVAVPGCSPEVYGHRQSFPDGFDRPGLLKGKRVSVTTLAGLTGFLLDVLLESAGLQTSDVEVLSMRRAEGAPALIAGQVDALVELDLGFSSPAVVPGPSVASIVPGFQYTHVLFGRNLLDGDPGPGKAFLSAYLRGVRAFRAGAVPRAMDELARGSGLNPAAVSFECRRRVSEDGRVDLAGIQRVLDWSIRRKFLRGALDAEQVIDRRFLGAAAG